MKNLYEWLTEYIFEASGFIYTINYNDVISDVADEILKMSEEQYIDAVKAMSEGKVYAKNAKWDTLVQDATKAWFALGHDIVDIPFCFDQKKSCKLRLAVAQKLGYKYQSHPINGVVVGNGSISLGPKITTEEQETATVICWNRMMKSSRDPKGGFDINNAKDVEEAVASVGISLDKSWIKSCQAQCIALFDFLKNTCKVNPEDYYATRYGSNEDGEFGVEYGNFVNVYMKAAEQSKWDEEFTGRISKDNYDPSDIILYKKDASAALKRCMGKSSWEEMHDEFLKEFESREFMGVSLKKVSGKGKVEFFNVGKDCPAPSISNINEPYYTPKGATGENVTGCKVKIDGKFNFSGVTDPNASDPYEHIEESSLVMELRSFGSSIGMDIKAESGPSLGKVPVRFWEKVLGVTNDKNNLANIANTFGEFANNKNKSKLAYLVQEGVKCGPWCLPFVLIH